MEDCHFHHILNHLASDVIIPVSLPAEGIAQTAGHTGVKGLHLDLRDLRPVPTFSESSPESPALERFRPFLGKILGKVSRPFFGNPHDVDATPARALGELAALVHVDTLVRDEMDMQAVFLVKFENPQPASLGPSTPDQRQQVIPFFSGIHQVEDFGKREGPEIESALFRKSVTGEEKCGFAFGHLGTLLSCSW